MRKMVKKNLQIAEAFAENFDALEHGGQQEVVNAALLMWYCAEVNQKRYWVRMLREMNDDGIEIVIRPSGHSAVFAQVDPETLKSLVEMTQRTFPGPPVYLDDGLRSDLPQNLEAEKYPAPLEAEANKKKGKRPWQGATEQVSVAAARKPKPQRRRRAGADG